MQEVSVVFHSFIVRNVVNSIKDGREYVSPSKGAVHACGMHRIHPTAVRRGQASEVQSSATQMCIRAFGATNYREQ